MKKTLILFSLISSLSLNYSVLAETSGTGKYDKQSKETYSEYLDRKNSLGENISGKFTGAVGPNNSTLTFSQAHIKCTNEEKIIIEDINCSDNSNCTSGSSSGEMKVERYNACMADYAPFLDSQDDGINSCGAQKVEWGEYGANSCFAELIDVPEFKNSLTEGSSILVQNQNLTDSFQGFAKVVCDSGVIKVLDSKCTLVPKPCEAGDTIGDPDRLPARYKDNESWRTSHLWPVTEPSWARPSATPYYVNGDPRNIDRTAEFNSKVSAGQREDYCYATLSPANAGTLGTDFPVKSGDLIVNPKLDNTSAFFNKENSNGVFRCFDGEFYNEGSNCQYVEQSCDATMISVANGKGKSCEFNLPTQKHNSIFTDRNPSPENSLGHVKAFCWDGQWEIWEESCNLSCENSLSGENWNSEDGDPQSCNHSAKVFSGRTAPTAILTVSNENNLMDGNKSYKCDNGEWVNKSQSCLPKGCSNLSANNWVSATDSTAFCSHKSLGYTTPHNKKITTSANNGSNATVGYISYQCRYGQFSDITNYTGLPEFTPTVTGYSPSDESCTSTIYPPKCYFDLDQTAPSDDPSIFIDQGDGCYIECRVDNLTGELNCTKSCTNTGSVNPNEDCYFPGGFDSCITKGWYDLGTEVNCPSWKSTAQVCTAGAWLPKNIPEKNWASKTVTSFSEILTKSGYVDNNVKPIVQVDFGSVYNIYSGRNEYGYGNAGGSPILDKGVTSGTGASACNSQTTNIYGQTDTSDYCFAKAEQSGVKDWQVIYEGTAGCELIGARSGEWTTSKISVKCASTVLGIPSVADVSYTIRYNDGLTLVSPKIAVSASIKAEVIAAGYCPTTTTVDNIPTGDSGSACESTITMSNNIQAGTASQVVNEIRYKYDSGVCYEVKYTGSLTCVDNDPSLSHESLSLQGGLSCLSNPVAAFNCGVSESPKWETEVSNIQALLNQEVTLEIPFTSGSNIAYKASGNYISVYSSNISGCDSSFKNCNAKLAVVTGNEVNSWAIARMDTNANCSFVNTNKTVNMKSGLWYAEAGKLTCKFIDPNDSVSVVLDFRLKDGTIVRTKELVLVAKS